MAAKTVVYLYDSGAAEQILSTYSSDSMYGSRCDNSRKLAVHVAKLFSETIIYDFGKDYLEGGSRRVEQTILNLIRTEKPQYILWVAHLYEIRSAFLQKITSCGICIVAVFSQDNEQNFDKYSRWWLPFIDYVITDREQLIDSYRRRGIQTEFLDMSDAQSLDARLRWIMDSFSNSTVFAERAKIDFAPDYIRKKAYYFHLAWFRMLIGQGYEPNRWMEELEMAKRYSPNIPKAYRVLMVFGYFPGFLRRLVSSFYFSIQTSGFVGILISLKKYLMISHQRYFQWMNRIRFGFGDVGVDLKSDGTPRVRGGQNIFLGNKVELGYLVLLDAVTYGGGHIKIGNRVILQDYARIVCYGGSVEIGSDTSVNQFCVLQGNGGIKIGSQVRIAPHVIIVAANHGIESVELPIMSQVETAQGVVVEDNVWIGANAVILDGVTISTGAVVAAGAVVTHSVPSYHVVAGVPARTIKVRKSESDSNE